MKRTSLRVLAALFFYCFLVRTLATVAWWTPSCLPTQRLVRPGVS